VQPWSLLKYQPRESYFNSPCLRYKIEFNVAEFFDTWGSYGQAVKLGSRPTALQPFFFLFYIFNFTVLARILFQTRLKDSMGFAIHYFPIFLQVFEKERLISFYSAKNV